MAVELATAYVALTVETRNIAKEVQQGFDPVQKIADKSGAQAGKRFSGSMGKMFAGLGGLFAGAMAGIGVKDLLADSIAEARESQKVGALTAAVIKSTGGAAKITAEQVGDLANALSRKTGIDDEAIQTGSNLLLTFKNVRNEAGKGNDVFNQATTAALDLSKAGFGSVESASKTMGKALNDPVKGITALGRAGVTFSEDQKKAIKEMVKTGDLLGAQKIILQEVNSQVGGAAEATATAGDKAKVTFDNLKESLGTALLPVIDDVSTKFVELVDEWQNGVGTGGQLRDILGQVTTFVKDNWKAILITVGVIAAWRAILVAITVAQKIHATWIGITTAATKLQNSTAVTWLGVKALELAAWARSTAATVANTAVAVANRAVYGVGYLTTWIGVKALELGAWVRTTAATVASTAATVAQTAVTKAAALATKVAAAGQWLLNAALSANPIGLVVAAIVGLVAIIVLAYKKNETFRKIVDAVWAGIKAAVMAVVDWFKNTAWPWIKGFIDRNVEAFQLLKAKVLAVWDNVKAGMKVAWDWISKNVFDPIKRGVALVQKGFEIARDGIKTAWNALQDIAKKPVKFIIETVLNNGLIAGFNWLSSKIGGPHIDKIKLPQGFAGGGVLPGYTPGRDVHRFFSATGGVLDLSGGEAVMRPEFTRAVGGKAGVDALNAAARSGKAFDLHAYAGGGVLDWIKSKSASALAWVSDKASDVFQAVTNPAEFLRGKLPKIPGGKTISEYGTAVVEKGIGLAVGKVKDLWRSFKSAFDSQGSNARTVSELTAAVKRILPDTQISSGYRPGSITALGNVSQHAKGLAIDIVPHSGSRFDAIKRLFPNAYQLFYSPRDGQTLLNGKPWRMDPTTKAGHWDHIHLSNKRYAEGGIIPKPLLFDQGGVLPTGTSLVHNGTGAPEPLSPVAGVRDINVTIPLEDLAQLKTLEDFLELLDKARVTSRKTARSGKVSA